MERRILAELFVEDDRAIEKDKGTSTLDIVCEKDIEIPFENIWKFYIDEKRSRNHDSIHNVYGADSSIWRDCLKAIRA